MPDALAANDAWLQIVTPNKRAIFFLTTDSKPLQGGAAQYLHGLCEGLGEAGASVTVLSAAEGSAGFPTLRYELRQLNARPARGAEKRAGDQFLITRKLNTLADHYRLKRLATSEIRDHISTPGAVVIHYWPVVGHFWCAACRALKIPYHLLCHGLELLAPSTVLTRRWVRADIIGAEGVIVSNRAAETLVHKTAGSKIPCVVINPAIDRHSFSPVPKRRLAETRASLRLPEDALTLLSVGRLVKRKGFDLVIDAMASLQDAFPQLYYLIIGDGPERNALRDRAARLDLSRRVIFREAAPDAEKWLLYALCDLFVMPNRTLSDSDWEGFGIVFLEAALAGKPSIGGRNGGVPDAIEDGRTGILVNPETREELTQAIRFLLGHPDQRREMGERAKERALRDFTWDRSSQLLAQALFPTGSNADTLYGLNS